MLTKFLLLTIVGKILLYTLQKFPLTIKIKNLNNFMNDLFSCDFCLGVWVFTILDFWFEVWFEGIPYVEFLSPLVMGTFVSFVVHLVSLGWRAKFEVIVIE